ncbi:MAG: conjugal transfer protein TrbF [Synergistaceae bacterium]|nr:conjugal transfer protein TrbF [Synergistaceae bacterium]
MSDNNFQENPYLSARKEYSDRYGSAVKDAARWRQISILMVLLCLAFGGTMMWLASQNKVVPYIVQVDKQGYAVAIKSAREGSIADTRVVVAALGGFFVNFKTVVTDVASQRRMVNDVYSYLAKNSSAETSVSQYYKEHNPFIATQDKREYTVQVEIRSIVRSGGDDKSWQVLWAEEKVDQGAIIERTEWRALVSVVVSPVRELEEVLKNPLGIFITEINMAQDINITNQQS